MFKNSTRREHLSNRLLSVIAWIIVAGSFAIGMFAISYYLTHRLVELDQTFGFVSLMLFFDFAIVLIKGVFESLNVLYFSKDVKQFLRMPIEAKDIVHSKLLKMITSEFEFEVIMLAIPMINYGRIIGASWSYYCYIPIIMIVLPIIPICITSFIVAIVMRMTNVIKNKSKVLYISILAAIILLNVVLIILGNGGKTLDFQSLIVKENNSFAYALADNFKLIYPNMNMLLNYNNTSGYWNALGYSAISFAIYGIAVFLISKIYLKGAIGTTINSSKKIGELIVTDKDFKQRSLKKAYLLKEFKIILRSPIFFIQCIVLPFIFNIISAVMIIGLVALSNRYNYDIMQNIRKQLTLPPGFAVFFGIAGVFYMMGFSSIIGVSKEEKWAILSKYIPVDLRKQFKWKLVIGEIINFLCSIPLVVFYYWLTRNVLNTIYLLIILWLLNIIGEKFKLFIDLNNPKLNWENEYTMMKQNTNVMYEMFYTFSVVILFTILGMFFFILKVYLPLVIAILLYANLLLNYKIGSKKTFEKLY